MHSYKKRCVRGGGAWGRRPCPRTSKQTSRQVIPFYFLADTAHPTLPLFNLGRGWAWLRAAGGDQFRRASSARQAANPPSPAAKRQHVRGEGQSKEGATQRGEEAWQCADTASPTTPTLSPTCPSSTRLHAPQFSLQLPHRNFHIFYCPLTCIPLRHSLVSLSAKV